MGQGRRFASFLTTSSNLVVSSPTVYKRKTGRHIGVRIIITSISFILTLTLWSFDGKISAPANLSWHFFVLKWGKVLKFDILANIVLFVPFGYGVAAYLQLDKRLARLPSLMSVAVTSLIFSYSIELAQLLLPSRYPSMVDVITDTFGGILGFICFELLKTRRSATYSS